MKRWWRVRALLRSRWPPFLVSLGFCLGIIFGRTFRLGGLGVGGGRRNPVDMESSAGRGPFAVPISEVFAYAPFLQEVHIPHMRRGELAPLTAITSACLRFHKTGHPGARPRSGHWHLLQGQGLD